jgi:alpha-N-acetylglucosaminidase
MRIKAAHRIRKLIKEVDPEGVWVTDTWDMACSKRWNKHRVKKYLDSFPNKGMYMYETAAESLPMYDKYNHWHGKEWAFGVIHSFAGKEILHGNIRQTIRRANEAADSKTCTGLFMVPESTHHNIMFWDMTTRLAWRPSDVQLDDFMKNYAVRRYGEQAADDMYGAWKKICKVYCTPVRGRGLSQYVYGDHPWYHWLYDCPIFRNREKAFNRKMKNVDEDIAMMGDAMRTLLKHGRKQRVNPALNEDVVVVFLNYAAKRFQREAGDAYIAFRKGDKRRFRKYRRRAMDVVNAVPEVLAVCPSYSINRTIKEACSVKGRSRYLPEIIRQACINVGYVNNDVYEQFPGQYIPMTVAVFGMMERKIGTGNRVIYRKDLKKDFERIQAAYRMNGWNPRKRAAGDPVRTVERVFLRLEGMKK